MDIIWRRQISFIKYCKKNCVWRDLVTTETRVSGQISGSEVRRPNQSTTRVPTEREIQILPFCPSCLFLAFSVLPYKLIFYFPSILKWNIRTLLKNGKEWER